MRATPEYIKDRLEYDADSGLIRWKIETRLGRKPGTVAGTVTARGYIIIGIGGRPYLAHRLAWLLTHGRWPASTIDHINGDKSDNRLANLREATRYQNGMNVGPSSANKSGVRGVCFDKRSGSWEASIKANGRRKKLGLHKNFEDAVKARKKAEAELFGEFAFDAGRQTTPHELPTARLTNSASPTAA